MTDNVKVQKMFNAANARGTTTRKEKETNVGQWTCAIRTRVCVVARVHASSCVCLSAAVRACARPHPRTAFRLCRGVRTLWVYRHTSCSSYTRTHTRARTPHAVSLYGIQSDTHGDRIVSFCIEIVTTAIQGVWNKLLPILDLQYSGATILTLLSPSRSSTNHIIERSEVLVIVITTYGDASCEPLYRVVIVFFFFVSPMM